MASRGQSLTVTYVAWDTSANAGKTGDDGNHTLRWIKDGSSAAPDNSPSEVDATNAPGVYKVTLTGAECTCWIGTLAGKSSTADVSIIPVQVGFEQLPGRITKNTALNHFEFFMVDVSDHLSGKTGLTVTATRSIDGAAFAACANSVSEVANGVYKINLAATDLNGDVITFRFTAVGADTRVLTIITQPTS